jgi:hypothetical protein
MENLTIAALAHAASLSTEGAAEFLLKFAKKEEKRLAPDQIGRVRVRIVQLLDMLEKQREMQSEFTVMDVAADDDEEDFLCVEKDAEEWKPPLEVWKLQQQLLREAEQRVITAKRDEFVVLERSELDDWALMEVPAVKSSQRSRRELFGFCRGRFRERDNVRLMRFRSSWALFKQERVESPSLLPALRAAPKRMCGDCNVILGRSDIEIK